MPPVPPGAVTLTSSVAPRVASVEPLRGIAALAVAWFHFTVGSRFAQEDWLKSTGEYGWLGVEIFFVISGFIIPYALHHGGYVLRLDFGRFLVKRVGRLDPPYLAAIALAIGFGYLSAMAPGFQGPQPHLEWVPLLLHLGYLNAFFDYPWAIPVLWTLAIEFQFYFLMAVTFPLIAHRSAAARTGALALFVCLSFWLPGESLVFHYLALFTLGILTFHYYAQLVSRPIYLAQLALVAVLVGESIGYERAAAGLCAALVIAFVRPPTWRALSGLGAISYSLYLLHVPVGGRVVNLGRRFADDLGSRLLVLAAAVVLSIAAAYLFYRFIERPARRWSSSIRYRGARSAPAE